METSFSSLGRKYIGYFPRVVVCMSALAFLNGGNLRAQPTDDYAKQVSQAPLFPDPLLWVGSQAPSDAESEELIDDIGIFKTNGVAAGFAALKTFVTDHPQSPWTPALEVHMAEYYRIDGNYTPALTFWKSAWDSTKDSNDAAGQKVAARAIAGLSRLLASLGRKDELRSLFKELDDRHLSLGPYSTTVGETKEAWAAMNLKPGESYRCGSLALGNLANALGVNKQTSEKLLEVDSPDAGFTFSQLLALAATNGLSVEAVQAPAGAELVVPSLVHWKLNHYAAITAKKGSLYRVEDPTFRGHTWMTAEAIQAESSGDYIVSATRVPASWTKLSDSECDNISGKGTPNKQNDSDDDGAPDCPDDTDANSDSSCDPPASNDGAGNSGLPPSCPSCIASLGSDSYDSPTNENSSVAMPRWYVSEPYITLWLRDIPVLYHQSDQRWMQFKISYKSRGESQNANIAGFGDKWSCNWIGMLESQSTSSDSIVDHLAGGGVRSFLKDGTPDYKTGRVYASVTVSGSDPPALVSPIGSQNIYGYAVGYLTGSTNYFLTQRRDQYGRLLGQFNYQTTNGIVRLISAVDMDGQTNTLIYGNTTFPNFITAVTDRYGRSAHFNYNGGGLLISIVDALGMSNYFQYDGNENITNMVTPYGPTAFQYYESGNGTNTPLRRAILITEASGDKQLYAFHDDPVEPSDQYGDRASFHWNRAAYAAISADDKTNVLDMSVAAYHLAGGKHWLHGDDTESGAETVSDTLGEWGDAVDPLIGQPYLNVYTYEGQIGDRIPLNTAGGMERIVAVQKIIPGSPPGNPPTYENKVTLTRNGLGRPTSYTLVNQGDSTITYTNIFDASGTTLRYQVGPEGELVRGYGYDLVVTNLLTSATNAVGDVIRYTHNTNTMRVTSIIFPSGLVRTNIYYTSGPNAGFLAQQLDLGFRTNSFSYTNGNISTRTNELGLATQFAYDSLNRPLSILFPDGTTTSNVYNKLDLAANKDRLNHWAYYGYNAVQQLMAATNVNNEITTYDYCGCGSPDQITRWNGSRALTTQLSYNMAGLLTNILYPDGYQVGYAYDRDEHLSSIVDGAGNQLTLTWVKHGMQDLIDTANIDAKLQFFRHFDEYGRTTNNMDRNGQFTSFSYDYLDRMTNRMVTDPANVIPPAVDTFVYNARGLMSYIDALGKSSKFGRDTTGRIMFETNANNEMLQFTYNPSDEMLTLTDGKNQTTSWSYDFYGRVTNKVDAASNLLLVYQYDQLNRLTNRWSIAKGNTAFAYDAIGNLTSVAYLSGNTSNVVYNYDALNRLTNMADGLGSTVFTWTDGSQLASEDGPWSDDTLSYAYNSARQRMSLGLLQPNAGPWTQSYEYDAVMRLANVLSPAGNFAYSYRHDEGGSDQIERLTMDNNNYIDNYNGYDGMARLIQTTLRTAIGSQLQFQYAYAANFQRTQEVFSVDSSGNNSFKNYAYDNIGQLKAAQGFDHVYDSSLGQYVDTARLHEQFGYAYDGAWNLSQRTNNALVQSFTVNNLNELAGATRSGTLTVAGTATELRGSVSGSPAGVTNVTVSGTGLASGSANIYHDGDWARAGATPANGTNTYTATGQDTYGRTSQNSVAVNLPSSSTFAYDLNGNLLTNNTRFFDYDDENQLIRVTEPTAWKTEFTYDGLMRMRKRKEFTWSGSTWVQTNEIRYLCDGRSVIQERDANNLPLVTYTRGNDLNGTLQGGGGIGGLLARTDNRQLTAGSSTATVYYFSDANGNIMALAYTNGLIAARYSYDPFGNVITMNGPLAAANKYRFSSKELIEGAELYYYGYRFYSPNLQRWLNRDPLGDTGGLVNQVVDITRNQENTSTDESTSELFDAWVGINKNLYGGIGNNPVNVLDYFGLKPGDPYPTCDAAGIQAIKDINPESTKQGVEYAGSIYKSPDNSYSYTAPNKGTKEGSDHGSVPAGKKEAGLYHTHGGNEPGFNNEGFSTQDMINSDFVKVPSYLGTPSGDIKKYTPDPKHPGDGPVQTIGTCK
jgi:RHS repeat-associated protein